MRIFLSIFSFLILLTTVSTGLSEQMSEKEWKQRVVGKLMTGQGLSMRFNKDGTFNGTFATKDGKINQLRGTWTYTKSRGYCRKLTVILDNGDIKERGEECQKMNFKKNGIVSVNNFTYTLK